MRAKIIFLMLLIVLFSSLGSALDTSLSVYETGSDNQTYVGTDMIFYANYSSDDGFNLGQVMYRNPTDLTTGYYVRAFDPNGVGNKTALVYSESANIRAHYANENFAKLGR